MDQGTVMEIFRDALSVVLRLAFPLLIGSMVVGLIIAVFQAATQVSEQTLTFVPKLLTIGAMLLILGPWMMTQLIEFVGRLFTAMGNIA
ncbi:MAG: flagellar biosynthesis protein FliQ [Oscillospiraceae bacterium]|nr:flagellar biosynthesis protein FliQ [Oscillospiraceae bacterium]